MNIEKSKASVFSEVLQHGIKRLNIWVFTPLFLLTNPMKQNMTCGFQVGEIFLHYYDKLANAG